MSLNVQIVDAKKPTLLSAKDLKKIVRKSLKLLKNSELELQQIKNVLNATVSRIVEDKNNNQVRQILLKIKSSMGDDLDISLLNRALDELFSVINERQKLSGSENNERTGFYLYLQDNLKNYDFSSLAMEYKEKINALIDNGLSNNELAEKILKLINELVVEVKDANSIVDEQVNHVRSFESSIRRSVFNSIEVKKKDNIKTILDELSDELIPYIKGLNSGADNHSKTNPVGDLSFSDIFIRIIEKLDLPVTQHKRKASLIKKLSFAPVDEHELIIFIDEFTDIIDDNISALQRDKKELSEFIIKITQQLADIEAYVTQSRLQHVDVVIKSAELRDSVDISVNHIQHKVSEANDICQLKKDVQSHLSTIMENVEKHKQEEKELEQVSIDEYDSMMRELAQSREQTEQLKEDLEHSRTALMHDTLTGAANRLAYNERIVIEFNRWQRKQEPLCLAMWDLDHFKNINDNYGHDTGDKVLKVFTKIIHDRIRKMDMFARLGGEEFVLMMPNTDLDAALALNNQLRLALQQYRFKYQNEVIQLTASVGLAAFNSSLGPDEVLKRADEALYNSKHSGRNCCNLYK